MMITAVALRDMMTQYPLCLIDVREEYEHDEGFIMTDDIPRCISLNVPMGEIESHLEQIKKIHSDYTIVIYCGNSSRSKVVKAFIEGKAGKLNQDILILEDGYSSWVELINQK